MSVPRTWEAGEDKLQCLVGLVYFDLHYFQFMMGSWDLCHHESRGVCSVTVKKTQKNQEGTVGKNGCLPPRGEKAGFVITSHGLLV